LRLATLPLNLLMTGTRSSASTGKAQLDKTNAIIKTRFTNNLVGRFVFPWFEQMLLNGLPLTKYLI